MDWEKFEKYSHNLELAFYLTVAIIVCVFGSLFIYQIIGIWLYIFVGIFLIIWYFLNKFYD
jgi:Flp pilus assembly protein TadB